MERGAGGFWAACAGVGSVTLLSLGDGSAGIGSGAQWSLLLCTGLLFTATTASTAATAEASGAGAEEAGGSAVGATVGAGTAGVGDATGCVAAAVTVTTGIDFSSRLPVRKKFQVRYILKIMIMKHFLFSCFTNYPGDMQVECGNKTKQDL